MSIATRTVIAAPPLRAATPQRFLDTHLEQHLARHESGPVDPSSRTWVDLGRVLSDDAALLRQAHGRILAADGGSAQMAAKWVVAWVAGSVADAVGFVLGTGSAGVLAGSAPIRWRMHPDGWVDRVSLDGCTVLVTADHPWAGRPDVEVVDGEAELVRQTVDSLVAAVRPVVDAVRGLARVGARGLWAEVADQLGMATLLQPALPVREDVVDRLQAALLAPGAPWRVSPTVRTTTAPWGEQVYLGQKGGCCLAYQRPEQEPLAEADLTDDLRAYLQRFPPESGAARVCSTCSLRDAAGCEQRQLFWLERRR